MDPTQPPDVVAVAVHKHDIRLVDVVRVVLAAFDGLGHVPAMMERTFDGKTLNPKP